MKPIISIENLEKMANAINRVSGIDMSFPSQYRDGLDFSEGEPSMEGYRFYLNCYIQSWRK